MSLIGRPGPLDLLDAPVVLLYFLSVLFFDGVLKFIEGQLLILFSLIKLAGFLPNLVPFLIEFLLNELQLLLELLLRLLPLLDVVKGELLGLLLLFLEELLLIVMLKDHMGHYLHLLSVLLGLLEVLGVLEPLFKLGQVLHLYVLDVEVPLDIGSAQLVLDIEKVAADLSVGDLSASDPLGQHGGGMSGLW